MRPNHELQALRGLAIVYVILFHFILDIDGVKTAFPLLLPWFDGGSGVDLFFVISGYVVTKSLLRQGHGWHGLNRSFYAAFVIRRIVRIIVPAAFWIIATYLLILIVHDKLGPLLNNSLHAAAALLQVANFYSMIFCESGPTLCGKFGFYWSLSIEEQFYCLLPLMLLLSRRAATLLFLLMSALVYAAHYPRLLGEWGWFARALGLGWGVMLAIWGAESWLPRLLKRLGGGQTVRCAVLVLSSCAVVFIPFAGGTLFFEKDSYVGVALASILCVTVAAAQLHLSFPRCGAGLLARIGDASFSLYLCHLPVLWFVQLTWQNLKLPEPLLVRAPAIAILAAALAWYLAEWTRRRIENPAHDAARRLSDNLLGKHGGSTSLG